MSQLARSPHGVATMLASTVHPAPAGSSSNPYIGPLSAADERLTEMELAGAAAAAPTAAPATAGRGTARPSTAAAGGRRAAATAAVTVKARRPVSAKAAPAAVAADPAAALAQLAGASGLQIPNAGETFAAAQIRQLESEVSHLRQTIDVLLEARGGSSGAAAASAIAHAGLAAASSSSASSASPTRSGQLLRGSVVRVASGPDKEARVRASIKKHERSTALLADTLGDKKRRDQKIVAMQKEALRLRDPHTLAASIRPSYRRIDESLFSLSRVDPRPTAAVAITAPLPEDAPVPEGEAAGASANAGATSPMRSSVAVGSGASAAIAAAAISASAAAAATTIDGLGAGASAASETAAAQNKAKAKKKTPARPASARPRSSAADGSDDVLAATARSTMKGSAVASTPKAKAKAKGNDENAGSSSAPAKRPTTAGARLSATGAMAAAGASSSTFRPTKSREFGFMARLGEERKLSIRESKFLRDIEQRAEAEEAALHYKFEPQPIAPSTRDPELFKKITEKLDLRRHAIHAARAAKMAASFQPFTLVIQHCDELAARQAARLARFDLDEKRELAEGRKFRAVPIPSTMTNPDGMFFRLQRREAERPQRCQAMARALFATSALPPRMQLANETQRKRTAERAARLRAEEAADKAKHAFRRNSLPDLDGLYKAFSDSLLAARASAPVHQPEPFSFDQPERLEADLARKEKWVREYELQTSTSMALRRQSSAFAEGQNLTGEARGTMGGRRGSAGDALGGSSRSQSASAAPRKNPTVAELMAKSTAPPAAMTRSVQLKVASMHRRLHEQQEEQRRAAVKDEEYRAYIKRSTAIFAPLVRQQEEQRLSNFKPLTWHADPVALRAMDTQVEARQKAKEFAHSMRELLARAGQGRTPLFVDAGVDAKREAAAVGALMTVAETARRHGASAAAVLSEDERELLGATLRASGGGKAKAKSASASKAAPSSASESARMGSSESKTADDLESPAAAAPVPATARRTSWAAGVIAETAAAAQPAAVAE